MEKDLDLVRGLLYFLDSILKDCYYFDLNCNQLTNS